LPRHPGLHLMCPSTADTIEAGKVNRLFVIAGPSSIRGQALEEHKCFFRHNTIGSGFGSLRRRPGTSGVVQVQDADSHCDCDRDSDSGSDRDPRTGGLVCLSRKRADAKRICNRGAGYSIHSIAHRSQFSLVDPPGGRWHFGLRRLQQSAVGHHHCRKRKPSAAGRRLRLRLEYDTRHFHHQRDRQ
jgi:hypothetical protein